MSELSRLQELFWRSVRVATPPPEAEGAFVSRGALSGLDRLAIYRNAHWARLVDALHELFPSVVEALGDGPFARLASHYLAAHPPSHRYIEGVGERFAEFVATREPGLHERAALDWARYCVFIAPDQPAVGAESVDGSMLPSATLRVGAHVRACGRFAVWREGFGVHQRPVESGEAAALEAARTSLPFADWCELMGGPPDALAQRLGQWLRQGWVVELW